MVPGMTKCTATTAQGEPCKAWAIRASDPPLCAPHAGLTGAAKGNQNAVTHGYYRKRVAPAEILTLYEEAGGAEVDQEVILLRVMLHRLSNYINDPELSLEDARTVVPLIVSTSRALGYLKKLLPSADDIDWETALDEISADWDWDL